MTAATFSHTPARDRQRRRIAEEEHKVQRIVLEIKALPRPQGDRLQIQKLDRDYQRHGTEFKAVFREAIDLLKHQPAQSARASASIDDSADRDGPRGSASAGGAMAEPLLRSAAPEAVSLEVTLQAEKLDDLRSVASLCQMRKIVCECLTRASSQTFGTGPCEPQRTVH